MNVQLCSTLYRMRKSSVSHPTVVNSGGPPIREKVSVDQGRLQGADRGPTAPEGLEDRAHEDPGSHTGSGSPFTSASCSSHQWSPGGLELPSVHQFTLWLLSRSTVSSSTSVDNPLGHLHIPAVPSGVVMGKPLCN